MIHWRTFLYDQGIKYPEKCMIWAFGENFEERAIRDCVYEWDFKHDTNLHEYAGLETILTTISREYVKRGHNDT